MCQGLWVVQAAGKTCVKISGLLFRQQENICQDLWVVVQAAGKHLRSLGCRQTRSAGCVRMLGGLQV